MLGGEKSLPSRLGSAKAWALMLSVFLTLASWAFGSAPGASPDDDYHLSSIWCASGIEDGQCESAGDATQRAVPAEVSGVACFAFDAAKSADCQLTQDGRLNPDTVRDHGNWNGGYPPLFYAVMSLGVTDDLQTSVAMMRGINIAVAVFMLSLLVILLPRRSRHLVTVPLLVTSVPMGLFLVSSTNPSSWAVLSAAALWPALYAAFDVSGGRHVALLAYAFLTALLGAGARADSALFAVLAVGLVLLLRIRLVGRRPLALITCGAVVAVSATFFLSAGQSAALTTGLGDPAGTPDWLPLTVANAQALPQIWVGSLGYGVMGGTGWLDTTFPSLVSFCTVAAWVAVFFTGLRRTTRAKVAVLGITAATLVVYPLLVLARTGAAVGTEFQPRYVLPLLLMTTGLSLLYLGRDGLGWSRLQLMITVAALTTAHAIALHVQIRRYTTGLDVNGFDLDARREWWWTAAPSPMWVWVVGCAAFAVAASLVLADARGGMARAAYHRLRQEAGRSSLISTRTP
jgi:hypothetical protein